MIKIESNSISSKIFDNLLNRFRPDAAAVINGYKNNIRGTVKFYSVPDGTVVNVQINGLPEYQPATEKTPPIGPFGFHIHEGDHCTKFDPAMLGTHYNPDKQPHGNHAGDFPVLFSNGGYSQMIFFTDKFKPSDVVGDTVMIHSGPDDYRTQPSGAAGLGIACGLILTFKK